jgi:predicted small lipoprotein YifL
MRVATRNESRTAGLDAGVAGTRDVESVLDETRPRCAKSSGVRLGRASVLGLVFSLALYGCGQKGPLYLPDDEDEEQAQFELERSRGIVVATTSVFAHAL